MMGIRRGGGKHDSEEDNGEGRPIAGVLDIGERLEVTHMMWANLIHVLNMCGTITSLL